MRRATRRGQRGQGMLEFGLVLPIFMLLSIAAVIMYSWQLHIDSAQFSAAEGLQVASNPANATGPNGLLCKAGQRAYDAAQKSSFLSTTPLAPNTSGGACNAGVPDYTSGRSCPAFNVRPTYSNVMAIVNAQAPGSRNVIVVCSWCHDVSTNSTCAAPGSQDQLELVITVAGWKPTPVTLPFLGSRIPFYGQNSQIVQEYQA